MRTPIPRDEAPLVVTAHLDDEPVAILDGLRRLHFPPALNKVPAHVSLFHHLPGVQAAQVEAALADVCATTRPFDLWPAGAVSLGRGVAIRYEAEALVRLRAELARRFAGWPTPQDKQPFKAHVTIQNKVEPAAARALLERLVGEDVPVCRVQGATLWRYRRGLWERVATCRFGPSQYGEATR